MILGCDWSTNLLLFPLTLLIVDSVGLDCVQCGKSAAIYACAMEQGFTVIEV